MKAHSRDVIDQSGDRLGGLRLFGSLINLLDSPRVFPPGRRRRRHHVLGGNRRLLVRVAVATLICS